MAINQIQFQSGMSLVEFVKRYGAETQCQQTLKEHRWPHGYRCARCKASAHKTFVRGSLPYWQCLECGYQCSLLAGTIFEHTKLPLTTWFLAIYLLTQTKTGMSALALRRQLGVNYRTAWTLKHKLMQTMSEREESRQLQHVIQVDDAFLGGERTGGKRGRGSENKVPFVAAVETQNDRPRYVRFDVLPNWKKVTLTEWSGRYLASSAHVISDGLQAFTAVQQNGCTHDAIPHGTGKQSVQHPQFIWVNTVLGNLKTWLAGTFHGVRAAKYVQRYLREFQYRFNRRFDLCVMFDRLLHAAASTQPKTESRIRFLSTEVAT